MPPFYNWLRIGTLCSWCILCWEPSLDLQAQSTSASSSTQDPTIKIQHRGKEMVGRPLAWDGKEMALLRRDGRLSIVPVASDQDYQTISSSFRPFSVETMRTNLQQEFGNRYQVSVTTHFIVVHPIGDHQTWAMPFELLYSRFQQYFNSRKLFLQNPEIPLVAVVLNTRAEFDYFLRNYQEYDPQILGYYSPKSNRVITYQQGIQHNSEWLLQTDTIIHEAAHQAAFNCGLHSRFAPVPRWISEGLAMLFEAPGVNNGAYYTRLQDRINRGRLSDLKRYYETGTADGRIVELISDDSLFRQDPLLAYALSWGLTFYLTEKMPQQYFRFLENDAQRKNFMDFPAAQRLEMFGKAFGHRFEQLESKLKQYILSLE